MGSNIHEAAFLNMQLNPRAFGRDEMLSITSLFTAAMQKTNMVVCLVTYLLSCNAHIQRSGLHVVK